MVHECVLRIEIFNILVDEENLEMKNNVQSFSNQIKQLSSFIWVATI